MNLQRGVLRSRFGHRLLFLFISCAVLPTAVVALLALRDVTHQLDQQAQSRLHEGAKSIGLAIMDRLQLLESDLPNHVLSPDRKRPHAASSKGIDQGLERFVTRERMDASRLGPAARRHLASGHALLSTFHRPGLPPRIYLTERVDLEDESRGLVVGEISPGFLWGIPYASGLTAATALTILDDSSQVLYNSQAVSLALPETIARQLGDSSSGKFEWQSKAGPYVASYWSIFLKPSFGKTKWTIVLSASKSDVLAPIAAFKSTFLPLILLSLLTVVLLGLYQIRRSLTPLHVLRDGTRRIAMRDFDSRVNINSGDEFEQLATDFNAMATRLGRQFHELSEANEILRGEIRERELAEKALRESEEQLRQSQKMEAIGTLAGGVAHDFNNLLTVISSYSEMAIQDLEADAPMRADMEQVFQAAGRASALTRQLLAFSRKQVMRPKIVDLNQLVSAIEKMLRRLLGAGTEIRTVEGMPLARVKADPGQIDQVIMNLAVNARDAMPNGGRVTIGTANVQLDAVEAARLGVDPGAWVVLSVDDTGTGIDEATRARIFEPFFTTKERGKGTGLGLSTVYGIVQQSGGCIAVESELGRGTTFKVYLPALESLEERIEAEPDTLTAGTGSETILLVEDDEAIRVLVDRLLRQCGYAVLTASHAGEALLLSEQHRGPIHLLLTDVVMPLMSGRQLAERLRWARAEMRVLYMSGHPNDGVLEDGVLEGEAEMLEKPFGREALTHKVREVLDGAELKGGKL